MSMVVSHINPRKEAKLLYWAGWRVARIAEKLGEKAVTVHSWKNRDKWDQSDSVERVELVTEYRYNLLILKDGKEPKDFKEIDLLARQMERFSRIRKHERTGKEADLNPKVKKRHEGPRKKPERNVITDDQHTKLCTAFMEELFPHQKHWYRAGLNARIRDILKSRQIGATWFFAREAFIDAIETGRNQIFLSASKAQSHVFKQYIVDFAATAAEVELTGSPIILPNSAALYFLSTNAKTAQSYHGNLYVDEYFWINKFQQLRKVASGMAAHKQFRQTYFSTPSSLSHEAYPFWDGSLHGKENQIDVSHAALKAGAYSDKDGQWRQIVNILDAEASGFDLFDLEQLKLEYSDPEFRNLFLCEFIDDNQSLFTMKLMQKCMVDSWDVWTDFKPFSERPLGDRPVWLGYDPSLSGDKAALVVVAPPLVPGGKFRIIDKKQFDGLDFADQAAHIKRMTQIYNVEHIGIDKTGMGNGVWQLVKQFFPAVHGFNYNPELKVQMVLKAYDVISKGRLEFDAGANDVAAAFMAIKKAVTPGGTRVTFAADRSEHISHADLAWATMHALLNEPLEGQTASNQSILEIS